MLEVYNYVKEHCQIIGLSAQAGAGKDFIADNCFVPRGYKKIAFSWHGKVDTVSKGMATFDEVFETKPPRVRKLLQVRLTEQGRKLWGDFLWVDTTFCWIKLFHENWGLDKFILPDVRFPTELEGVSMSGGQTFRIISNRAQSNLTDKAKQHASETSLSDDDEYDGNIINHKGFSIKKLNTQVDILLS